MKLYLWEKTQNLDGQDTFKQPETLTEETLELLKLELLNITFSLFVKS